jgi:archaellin
MAVLAMAMAASLTSCYSENDFSQVPSSPGKGTQLTLSGAFASASTTRAFDGMDTHFPSTVDPHAYVFKTGSTATAAQLYQNVQLTPEGGAAGNLSEGLNLMYFPTSGDNIDVFVTYPSLGSTWPTTTVTHTISADQTTVANYYASDLVYGGQVDVPNTAPMPLSITFYHLLTKIRVAIVPGAGLDATDLADMTVTINNTKPQAVFTPSTSATVTSVSGAGTIAAAGTVGNITIDNDVSTDFTTGIVYNDAIIVPQSIDGDPTAVNFISITLDDGETLVYKLDDDKTFEAGKVYIYKLTANLSGLTLYETIITDWVAGDTTTGNLE